MAHKEIWERQSSPRVPPFSKENNQNNQFPLVFFFSLSFFFLVYCFSFLNLLLPPAPTTFHTKSHEQFVPSSQSREAARSQLHCKYFFVLFFFLFPSSQPTNHPPTDQTSSQMYGGGLHFRRVVVVVVVVVISSSYKRRERRLVPSLSLSLLNFLLILIYMVTI